MWCAVLHLALENVQKGGFYTIICIWQSSCETTNESRYKSTGDRYRSRNPAIEEFYCLFLDHRVDLCFTTTMVMMLMRPSRAFKV